MVFGHSEIFFWIKTSDSLFLRKIAAPFENKERKLEIDADRILRFMASNDLVANPSKTTFMVLNHKSHELIKVKVGECEITQEKSAKLHM